jgi:hypothetical protein
MILLNKDEKTSGILDVLAQILTETRELLV